MGDIIRFPDNKEDSKGVVFEFFDNYIRILNQKNESHNSVMQLINIISVIFFLGYAVMCLFLFVAICHSGKTDINKMFAAGVLLYTIVPALLLICGAIEDRWCLLSNKIGPH